MAKKIVKPVHTLDNLIQYVTLHERLPTAICGIVLPFVALYLLAFYLWYNVYGVEEFYEAGIVCIVALAMLHVFTCLCCYWSVHVLTFLNCRKVSGRIFWSCFFFVDNWDIDFSVIRCIID